MRVAALCLLVACSGRAPQPAPAPEPAEEGVLPPSVRIRPLGAPEPEGVPTTGTAPLAGSTWALETLEDQREVRFGADGTVSVGELSGPFVAAPGGGTAELSGARWTFGVLGPCAMVVYDPGREAWWSATRAAPACSAEELVWDGVEMSTWTLPGGDLYTLLPGQRGWRRGPGRSFDRPIGDVVLGDDGAPAALQFGPSHLDLVDLDPCHRVFVLREPRREHGAVRTFPACAPGQATHVGPAWTWWRVGQDQLSVLGDVGGGLSAEEGPFHLEGSANDVRGRWTRRDGAIVMALGDGPMTLTSPDGCTGLVTLPDGKGQLPAKRTYPACIPSE